MENAIYMEQHQTHGAQGTGLALAAFVLDIISCVAVGFAALFTNVWFVVALIWMVPMTVYNYYIYQGSRSNTVAFGVCTLLFVDLISGILLLCAPKDEVIYDDSDTYTDDSVY